MAMGRCQPVLSTWSQQCIAYLQRFGSFSILLPELSFTWIIDGKAVMCSSFVDERAFCGRVSDARARLWDGKSPVSIAAGVIYTICLLPQASKAVSPADIAQAAGVAEGTVRNTYRDLYADVATLVPAWFLDAHRLDLRRLPQPHSAAAPV